MDWMNSHLEGNEYEYFPPYSECADRFEEMEGAYTAYIRFFDFKADSVYPDIVFRVPRVHLTLTCGEPNDRHWILRGDLISSVYAPKPIFVGEYGDCCGGDHADDFVWSEVCTTLKKLLMMQWD